MQWKVGWMKSMPALETAENDRTHTHFCNAEVGILFTKFTSAQLQIEMEYAILF